MLQALVYALARRYASDAAYKKKAVAVLLPSRELREDLLQDFRGFRELFPAEKLWLADRHPPGCRVELGRRSLRRNSKTERKTRGMSSD